MATTIPKGLLAATTTFALLGGASAQSQTRGPIEGFSHPYRSAEVAASTSGTIKAWLVAEGASLTAGQPLVQLDDTIHQAIVEIAEAAVAARGELALAKAEQKLRRQRLDAIQELAKENHATADELHRAQSEWEVAVARVLVAEENQLRRKLELGKLTAQSRTFTVVAPYDGVVTKIHRLAGEYVGPVDPVVCVVAELEYLSVRFLAASEAVETLRNGDPVDVEFVASGDRVSGIATVSPYPDAETGMRSVHVKIANPHGKLPAGVRCRLLLESSSIRAPSNELPAMNTSGR